MFNDRARIDYATFFDLCHRPDMSVMTYETTDANSTANADAR